MTYPAHVRVAVVEPLPELGVVLGVLVEGLNGVADDLHAHAVGEALQERTELAERLLHRSLRAQIIVVILRYTGSQ